MDREELIVKIAYGLGVAQVLSRAGVDHDTFVKHAVDSNYQPLRVQADALLAAHEFATHDAASVQKIASVVDDATQDHMVKVASSYDSIDAAIAGLRQLQII